MCGNLELGPGARIEIEARIGVSFVSIGNARANFENEVVNESFNIEDQNREAWDKWFDRIQVFVVRQSRGACLLRS